MRIISVGAALAAFVVDASSCGLLREVSGNRPRNDAGLLRTGLCRRSLG